MERYQKKWTGFIVDLVSGGFLVKAEVSPINDKKYNVRLYMGRKGSSWWREIEDLEFEVLLDVEQYIMSNVTNSIFGMLKDDRLSSFMEQYDCTMSEGKF